MKIKDSFVIKRLFLSAICFFTLSVFLFCTDNGLFALLMLLIAVLIFIIGINRLINADKKDKSTKGALKSNHEDSGEYSLDLSKEEIEKIEKEHNLHPEERLAHKTLAKEVITFIHGEKAYEDALKQANALFNGDISSLGAENLLNEFKDVPHFIVIENENILDMLIRGKICSSKREAREMVSAGAISINGNKETNLDKIITGNDLIEEKVLLLKKGKKNYFLGTK